ncbi:MAG TPA: type VI secretion system baseplate subunit TssE [Rhizobiaceae bacterium]|nr:type VI secretion system baseplate subunit TssE [Rhizobiaceae bacterium]
MARKPIKRPVVLPLFDRLLQGDNIEVDVNSDRAIQVLRESIRRDLEILFNTRPYYRPIPKEFEELGTSVVSFGLPDLQIQQLGAASQKEECRSRLKEAIRRFEPRLRDVSVEIIEGEQESRERILRFRIDAIMDVAEMSEAVVYDTFVDPVSGSMRLAHETRARAGISGI